MNTDVLLSAVERSREALLAEADPGTDLTFVRGAGNLGDELIWAGTRQLLAGRIHREIGVDALPAASGHTAFLAGSGAFSAAYHDWMPRALAIAERRFEHVVVLPSSFDVRVDAVRRALERTRATVYAREATSLAGITGLCRARFAHDCAFFFDFGPYGAAGEGVLHAYRTDREALRGPALPEDNQDISGEAPDLEAWLRAIERHAVVRTDRAHVMLAAALMGKRVEWSPAATPKIGALAELLEGRDVHRRPRTGPPAPPPPEAPELTATRDALHAAAAPAPPAEAGPARVTAVVLTRDRPGLAERCVDSLLREGTPVDVLLLDANSSGPARAELAAYAATQPRVTLRLADRNLGCAGGRKLGAELATTEHVLVLDDDAELVPGALGHLLADLDAHPDAAATTALVVGPDGLVQHFGGWIARSSAMAWFELEGRGLPPGDPALPPTGTSGWIPGTAALFRAEALRAFPLDTGMAAYYEDNEWSARIAAARPGCLRRCREAVVLHTSAGSVPQGSPIALASQTAERLAAHARFLEFHGVLLGVDLGRLVPELQRPDGTLDEAAARLLLGLVAAHGTDWYVEEALNGGLGPLRAGLRLEQQERDAEARAAAAASQAEAAAADRAHLQGLLDARTAELAAARDAAELLRGDARQLEARTARAEEDRANLQDHVAFLEVRHETLTAIEAGGWWRLRGRLLRVLAVPGALGRRLRR